MLIMECYAVPKVLNHGVYTERVDVHHGVLFGVSGCDSWCVMLSQWL